MKKHLIKIISLALVLLIAVPFTLSSCQKADSELEIKIYALSGTTAMGMAQMISNAENDTDEMNYNIEIFNAADKITNAVITGECAIAALPTNVAAKLYKKSEGGVQLLALNTLGVLYVLDTTGSINTLSDLSGKTVYIPGGGSNPEYITAALINGAGISNVTLDTTSYPDPNALQVALAAGKVSIAVLPEPKVSVVTGSAQNVKVAIDLTAEWEKIYGENTLVQGCLVINKAFADEHPAEVKKFLQDYEASVNFISQGSDEAVGMVVDTGIIPKAPLVKKALPKCNLCCITGNDMKDSIGVFYEKIFALDKQSIGAMPDDGFYYVAK